MIAPTVNILMRRSLIGVGFLEFFVCQGRKFLNDLDLLRANNSVRDL